MNKRCSVKIASRFIAVLLIFACLLLFLSFLKHDNFNSSISTLSYAQSHYSVFKTGQIKHINRSVFIPAPHAFHSVDGMLQQDHDTAHHQNTFEFGKIYYIITIYVLLCGLIFVFRRFGTLSEMFSACVFTRYVVIPHSIHAPPYYFRRRRLKY